MKTIKKLDLKRETVRSLGVKAGIVTGWDTVQFVGELIPVASLAAGPPTAQQSIVGGVALASATHLPPGSIPSPQPGSLGGRGVIGG